MFSAVYLVKNIKAKINWIKKFLFSVFSLNLFLFCTELWKQIYLQRSKKKLHENKNNFNCRENADMVNHLRALIKMMFLFVSLRKKKAI